MGRVFGDALLRSHIGTCRPVEPVVALLQPATGVSRLLLELSSGSSVLFIGFIVHLSGVSSRAAGEFSGSGIVVVRGLLTAFGVGGGRVVFRLFFLSLRARAFD